MSKGAIEHLSCTRRIEFDAAHRVPGHKGKCHTLHGHRYVLEITCEADALLEEGFIIDFGIVKEVVGGWIDAHVDHCTILWKDDPMLEPLGKLMTLSNQRPIVVMGEPPTAENIAATLHGRATELLMSANIRVTHVRVYETPNCWADFSSRECS